MTDIQTRASEELSYLFLSVTEQGFVAYHSFGRSKGQLLTEPSFEPPPIPGWSQYDVFTTAGNRVESS